jgi:hypothetical protein
VYSKKVSDLQVGLWVVGLSALNWLAVAFHAHRDRRLWSDYYARQVGEVERRERLRFHARRVTLVAPAAAGVRPAAPGRAPLGWVRDETRSAWVGPRTITSHGAELVDRDGRPLSLPAGAEVHVHDDLAGAFWQRGPDAGGETTFDLILGTEAPFYILAEEPPPPPAEPYRGSSGSAAPVRVPRDLVVANPWIDLPPTYAVAADPRAFDFEVVRRGGLRVWIVGVAITALMCASGAMLSDAWTPIALGWIAFFTILTVPHWFLSLRFLRRAPPEPPRAWRAPER